MLSFPWNIALSLIETLSSFTLTVSSLLIGSASFILGLYLPKFEVLTSREKLIPYIYLIISLVLPPFIIIGLASTIIICSCQPVWLKINLLLILLTPLVPAIAILLILKRNIPPPSKETP